MTKATGGTWFVTVANGGVENTITVTGRDVRRVGRDCFSVDGDQRRVNGEITAIERGTAAVEDVAKTATWAGGRKA